MLVGRTHALVHVLRRQVLVHGRLQPQRGRAPAHAADQALLGGVEGVHHAAVVQRQRHAAAFQVHIPHRLQQQRFQAQVFAQHGVQLGQAVAHRRARQHGMPQHRHHAVPGCARQHAGDGIARARTAAVGGQPRIDEQDERPKGNGAVALAQRPQHGDAKGQQRHHPHQHPGPGHRRPDGPGHEAKTRQRQALRPQAPAPAVVGFGECAGDHAQQHRHQLSLPVGPPAIGQHGGQGDQGTRAARDALMVACTLPAEFPGCVHRSLVAEKPGITLVHIAIVRPNQAPPAQKETLPRRLRGRVWGAGARRECAARWPWRPIARYRAARS